MDISNKRISWSWYSGVTTITSDDKKLTDALKAKETAKLAYDEAKKEYFSALIQAVSYSVLGMLFLSL